MGKKNCLSRGYDRKKSTSREKNIPAAKGDKKCVILQPEKNKRE